MYPLDHVITVFMVPITKKEKILSFWLKFTMPNSVQKFFVLLEHENDLKTFFLSYIFDFKGFGREFPNYEEAQKSQWIDNLLSYLMLRKAKLRKAKL